MENTLLLQINKKLDLLLKAHGIQDTTVSKDSDKDDYEYGRSLARQLGPIRSDE